MESSKAKVFGLFRLATVSIFGFVHLAQRITKVGSNFIHVTREVFHAVHYCTDKIRCSCVAAHKVIFDVSTSNPSRSYPSVKCGGIS